MRTTTLGIKGPTVSGLCLGTNVFGWNTDEGQAHAIMDHFVSLGGNFIDTADSYSVWVEGNPGGVSESIIGSWLEAQSRGDIVIATKVGQMPDFPGYHTDYVNQQLTSSLDNLRTDSVDVYYAHKDDDRVPLEDVALLFHSLVEEGRIGVIGLSNFPADRVVEWLAICEARGYHRPTVMQPHYNLMVRKSYESELGTVAQDHSISVVPYAGLARGFLTGRYSGTEKEDSSARAKQALAYATDAGFGVLSVVREIAEAHSVEPATVALSWLFHRPEIAAPIASASSPDQLQPLVAAAGLTLTIDEIARLNGTDPGEA